MYLVLASIDDVAALWAYEHLKRRDDRDWKIVTAEMLTFALRWKHFLSATEVTTHITLADGDVIDSRAIHGALNRLIVGPHPAGHYSNENDLSYARNEFSALHTSWLHAVPQIVNPPSPQGLAGAWRDTLEWRLLAARAGLEAVSNGSDKERHVITVGTSCCGDAAPGEIRDASLALARLAKTPILGLDFNSKWQFVDATVYPDLRAGGDQAIDALIEVFD
jgi:hypothetical protein